MNKWIYAVIRWLINNPQDQRYETPDQVAAWEFIEATRERDITYAGMWPYRDYPSLVFPRAWLERAIVAFTDEQNGTLKVNPRRLLRLPVAPIYDSTPMSATKAHIAGLVTDEWITLHKMEQCTDGQIWAAVLSNLTALDRAHQGLTQNLEGTGGRYVGLKSWQSLVETNYSNEQGHYVPSTGALGFEPVLRNEIRIAVDWYNEMRDTERCYGSPMPLIWCCATQVLAGPKWVEALYETGYGLWCAESVFGHPEWVLVARPGAGFRWPWKEGETA